MNRKESSDEKLERQHRAVVDLRLEQDANEETQKALIQEAALRATTDNWPEMPEDERQRVIDEVLGFEALTFQWSIFRRGWSSSAGAERIHLDPEVAWPRILVRAYATAEAETVRMRIQAGEHVIEEGPQLTLEEKLRRLLNPEQ